MSGAAKFTLFPAVAALLLGAVTAAFLFQGTVAAQSAPVLGIDADPTGNADTSLGDRQFCIQVAKGDTFQVDITTENVSGLTAWEAYLKLDNKVVHVTDKDTQLFLASAPGSNTFDLSESTPEGDDDDGRYRVGAANLSEQPAGVDGSGVLARLTLEAVRSGVSDLSIAPSATTVGTPVGPVLTDKDANHIGDKDNDGLFDGPTLDARVAVDQPCTEGAAGAGQPVSSGIGGGDSGVPVWAIVAAAMGAVAMVGVGGAAFFRLRRAGPRNSL